MIPRRTLSLWFAIILLMVSPLTTASRLFAAGASATPIVKITDGQLQGARDNGVFTFKGIPYAAPPTGDLRWHEPEAAHPWSDIRKADRYGNACIQIPGLSAANGGEPGPLSEDCLYLNVWTPSLKPSASLPVLVWIHGGAMIFGAGGLPVYTGTPLAKRGIVVVNINYRLGQLGFFAHPALEKSVPGGPANFGLLDQIAALNWVKHNIQHFGGDPDDVTIMGQSAGGKSVLALFASPLAKGLFRKGVALSSYIVPDATRAKTVEMGSNVATALGLDGANATVEQLRAVPAEKFGTLKDQKLSTAPVPVAGDEVLPQSIEDTFSAGKELPLPLIVGNTSDDVSVATAFGFEPKSVMDRLGIAKVLVRALYPKVKDEREVARQAVRDLVFTMPARWIADRHSKRAPTWRYYFNYVPVKKRAELPNGVSHGAEIPYLLNTVDIFELTKDVLTKQDRSFSRASSEYILQFVLTGRPTSKWGPGWPNHKKGQDRTLIFGDDIEVRDNFMRARLNTMIGVTKVVDTILKKD